MRPRHPNKHNEAAIRYAERIGWRVEMSHGHAWGFLLCPHGERGGCNPAVYSTPRSPQNHARQLRRKIDRCPHGRVPEQEEQND